MHPNLITISGPPGSGTTTAAEHIIDNHPYHYYDAGSIFRRLADERGLTLAEFSELCETDDTIDKKLDENIREEILSTPSDQPLLIESRLAGWIALDQPALSIWLDAPAETRLNRTKGRDVETIAEMQAREQSEAQRYENYYGIDITDHSIYDLTLNTDTWSKHDMNHLISTAITQYTTTQPTSPGKFDPTIFEQ